MKKHTMSLYAKRYAVLCMYVCCEAICRAMYVCMLRSDMPCYVCMYVAKRYAVLCDCYGTAMYVAMMVCIKQKDFSKVCYHIVNNRRVLLK